MANPWAVYDVKKVRMDHGRSKAMQAKRVGD